MKFTWLNLWVNKRRGPIPFKQIPEQKSIETILPKWYTIYRLQIVLHSKKIEK